MNNIQYHITANPNSIPVTYPSRYPSITVSEKNLQYAQILMPDFASAASEMTTVHQYLYQSWTIDNKYKNIRRVIQRMIAVEQHHFSILGQLITLLGSKPECRSSNPTSFWCGNMVDYSCDLPTILSENAKSELFAAQSYMEQSETIKDPYISKILARLSLDEKLHYKIFTDFLSQIS